MVNILKSFARDEEGATMVEYGLMLALIAAVSITIVKQLGLDVKAVFTAIDTAVAGAV